MKAAILALILCGCSSLPDTTTGAKNACLPEAAMMVEALQAKGITARVLQMRTDKSDHAIAVYLYPPGTNTLWGWDSYWKSVRLRAWFADADAVARAWLDKTTNEHPVKAEYL